MILNDHQITGWDIGGVNIKAVRLDRQDRETIPLQTVVRPFEIWRDPGSLQMALRDMGKELGLQGPQRLAVTMTAELSDVFRTKREGVLYVLDAIGQAFEKSLIYPFSLESRFFSLDEARQDPLLCAATNWLASALFIAAHHPDCILMDIGSTTTDVIPIQGGKVITEGRTDTQRLITGELVYTGVLRTNPNAVVNQAPVGGRPCRVAAEYFTSMADVYLVLGQISPDEYTCPTADGRAKTIRAAQGRLARLVCSDSEIMDEKEIYALARYLWEKQLQQIIDSLFQVLSGLKDGFGLPLAVAGTGGFLAKEAARRLGMPTIDLGQQWGDSALACFPALAVAYLLGEELTRGIV
jgi:hypothetical protein